MPSLSDLGLNRYIKKDNQNRDSSDADSSMYGDIESSQGDPGSFGAGSGSSGNSPSNGLQPGSLPVQGILLQSSAGNDRVEINPDDSFYAYNDGDVVVTIDKNGITSANSSVDKLIVNNEFEYQGILQPVNFYGEILGNGTVVNLPTGWSVVRNSIGNYTFTHNLGALLNYFIFCSPVSGHFRHQVVSRLTNSFNITYEQTLYGSDVFPVVGGGGGTVTVGGVRLAPGEEPIDVGFQFQMLFFG